MKPNVLLVYPGLWRGWFVVRESDGEGPCFNDRTTALDYARAMAEALAPAEISVRDHAVSAEARAA